MKRDRLLKVIEKNGNPSIAIRHKGIGRNFFVKHSRLVPRFTTDARRNKCYGSFKNEEIAEAYLGEKVMHAVVTLPDCEYHNATLSAIH
jgi:hypothetical protein